MRRSPRWSFTVIVMALLLAALPSSARAQQAPAGKGGKRNVLQMDALTVEGKAQKPEAIYVLPRGNLGYQAATAQRGSLLPRVVQSLQAPPF